MKLENKVTGNSRLRTKKTCSTAKNSTERVWYNTTNGKGKHRA